MAADPATRVPWRATIVVELRDGQQIDLTDLPPAAAIDLLEATGVTPAMIRRTVHWLRAANREREDSSV